MRTRKSSVSCADPEGNDPDENDPEGNDPDENENEDDALRRRIRELEAENEALRRHQQEERRSRRPIAATGFRRDLVVRRSCSGETSRTSSIQTNHTELSASGNDVLQSAILPNYRTIEAKGQREAALCLPPVANDDAASSETHSISKALLEHANVHIRHEVGRGAFGVVYMLHVDTPHGRKRCALKIVKEAVLHANREAEHVRFFIQNPHPNIVPFYRCRHIQRKRVVDTEDGENQSKGDEDGEDRYRESASLHIHMMYVPYSLKQLLRGLWEKHNHLRPDVHVAFMAQLAKALEYIHSHHICHRDLKPDNVLVDVERERVYLADFGCAKVIRPYGRAKSETYICSRFYRAPELIIDRNLYGSAVDVWSLGCIFVECGIGRTLFPAENNTALLVAHIRLLGEFTEADVRTMRTTQCDLQGKFPKIENRAHGWARLHRRRTFGAAYEALCPRMLCFNVANRATARQLLASDYLRHYAHKNAYKDKEEMG